jgi:hypothetical protein
MEHVEYAEVGFTSSSPEFMGIQAGDDAGRVIGKGRGNIETFQAKKGGAA